MYGMGGGGGKAAARGEDWSYKGCDVGKRGGNFKMGRKQKFLVVGNLVIILYDLL